VVRSRPLLAVVALGAAGEVPGVPNMTGAAASVFVKVL
jgi:hypothetical protein